LKDFSPFIMLYSLAVMTVLSSYSSNKVGDEFNFNAQAQVIGNGQQPQQQLPSPLTTSPQTEMMPAIKITSHSGDQQVKPGPLTISGTSSDTPSTECEVFVDWNDSMPFRKAVADGPGGPDDYSRWTFSYDNGYHLIQNGTNNLTSKISCLNGSTNLTKWNSINLIGISGSDSGSVINQVITSGTTSSPSPTSSTVGLPLPPPSQADITSPSPPLDPVVEEVNKENEDDEAEGNANDDSDSDDTNDEEDDEEGNSNGDEDSGDNEDEENSDNDDDDGDNDDDDGDDDDGFFGGDSFFDD
jgi:hypothetical protein